MRDLKDLNKLKQDEDGAATEWLKNALANKQLKKFKIMNTEANPLNPYPMTSIEELADNILENGTLEPATGYLTSKGTLMLLGGHRRREACLFNLKRGGTEFIEAFVIDKPHNDLIELKVIGVLNSHRELDNKDKLEIVKKYVSLYKKLNANEKLVNGQKLLMRDWIGVQIGLKGRQVQNYIQKMDESRKSENMAMLAIKKISVPGISNKCLKLSEVIGELNNEDILESLEKKDISLLKDSLLTLKAEIDSLVELID